ncbi:hypothetical protein LXL04_000952 [Taraxacum kok-saghyz]
MTFRSSFATKLLDLSGNKVSQKTPKISIPSHFEFCPSTLPSALVPSQSVSHTHAALQSPTLSDTPLSDLASPDFASPNLAQTPPTSGSPLSDLAQTPRRRFPLIVANHQLRLLRNRLPALPSPPCSDVPSLLRRPLPVPYLFLDALRQATAITTCNSPHLLLIFDSFYLQFSVFLIFLRILSSDLVVYGFRKKIQISEITATAHREAEGRCNISAGEKEPHRLLQAADKTLKTMAIEFAKSQCYVDIASISNMGCSGLHLAAAIDEKHRAVSS